MVINPQYYPASCIDFAFVQFAFMSLVRENVCIQRCRIGVDEISHSADSATQTAAQTFGGLREPSELPWTAGHVWVVTRLMSTIDLPRVAIQHRAHCLLVVSFADVRGPL